MAGTVAVGSAIVGRSEAAHHLRRLVTALAAERAPVLITGETGSGKSLAARELHRLAPWAREPWLEVNCAALSPSVIESELFGHERGAFTGAVASQIGVFEAAGRGTLFLDEIGELTPPLQAKLLRVLEQRRFERVGGRRTLLFRARVVAATNRDLEDAVREGFFRRDLYFRLDVARIALPPLRQRLEDLPDLVEDYGRRRGTHFELPQDFLGRDWPGNIRELENALERTALLGDAVVAQSASAKAEGEATIERELLASGGNVSRVARRLGIPRTTLRRRIEALGLRSLIPDD